MHFSDHELIYRYLSLDNYLRSAHISWKFDYRPGNYYLTSLKLQMKLQIVDSSLIQWFIQTLPTRKNPNPEFKPFAFPLDFVRCNHHYIYDHHYVWEISDSILDLTELIKDEPGFILKAYIGTRDRRTNCFKLFRHDTDEATPNKNFGMDVKIELKPNIEQNDSKDNNLIKKNLVFNDRITSDFIIKLDVTKEIESEGSVEKLFYVHSIVLCSRSNYFQALFNSNMLESQIKCLKLNDISYFILEKLLLFIYTDDLENVDKFEDWIDLLYAASRFSMPQLIQICELSIRKFVNLENVEKVEKIAYKCDAFQLARYCEMFEIKKDDAIKRDDEDDEKGETIIELKRKSTNVVVKKFKSLLTRNGFFRKDRY